MAMKRIIAVAATALILSAGLANAGPSKGPRGATAPTIKLNVMKSGTWRGRRAVSRRGGRVTFRERLRIARSQAQLNRLKRRVRRDGIVTRFERRQVRMAQQRHNRLVRLARRS
jgi:hypothetical protein